METELNCLVNDQRMSTAICMEETQRIHQIFPNVQNFPTRDAWAKHWYNTHPDAVFNENTYPVPAGNRRARIRQRQELEEFFAPCYKEMFSKVERIDDASVRVTMRGSDSEEGDIYTVERDQNFLGAPRVYKNGKRLPDYEYSPALTSVRWLLMLAFIRPDE